ncbi:MAG: hypothetical protein Q9187_003282, partial [Circinaria calcarea]
MNSVQEFLRTHDLSKQSYSVLSLGGQLLNKELGLKKAWGGSLQMTSWNVLYYRLRANFDGFSSEYCDQISSEAIKDGKAVYDQGNTVKEVAYNNRYIKISFDNVNDGGRTLHADLVIAADGSNSSIRSQILQREMQLNSKLKYAGYTIPGENGNLTPNKRLLNFVWFCNYADDSQELADIMIDSEGRRHRNTLLVGKMCEEVWTRQKAYAAKVLLAHPFPSFRKPNTNGEARPIK